MGILLSEVINALDCVSIHNCSGDALIQSLAYRPDQVGDATAFICMDEYLYYNRWCNWRHFLQELSRISIALLIVPERVEGIEVPQIVVENTRRAAGVLASLLRRENRGRIRIVGVTGTNGKTSTTHFISELYELSGTVSYSLGTLGLRHSGHEVKAGDYTTPLAGDFNSYFEKVVSGKGQLLSMEVSSHALELERVHGIEFDVACLTNLGRDHLDFHGTEQAYRQAKLKLFEQVKTGGISVLNLGSPVYREFSALALRKGKVFSYAMDLPDADLSASIVESSREETVISFSYRGSTAQAKTRLSGRFQVENIVCASAVFLANGGEFDALLSAVPGLSRVPGRMERWKLLNQATVFIDYAHNPDGLENLLLGIRELSPSRLICIFGCGGDRDRGKRTLMGEIAHRLCDRICITSDNPRTENPRSIIDDIASGIPDKGMDSVKIIEDRAEAIRVEIESASPDDVVVIAGKGHEAYQIIGVEKIDYSDQAVLSSLGAMPV